MIIAREFNEKDEKRLFDMINEIRNYDNNFEGLTNIKNVEDYEKN
jgi:hypothetical protein